MSRAATPTPQAATASVNASTKFAPVLRKHITHALVAAVLAGVAWAVGVRPLEAAMVRNLEEVSRLESQVSAAAATAGPDQDIEVETKNIAQRIDTTVAWVEQIDDATEIYDAITRSARATGVSVQRIDPTGTRQLTSRSTTAPKSKNPKAAQAPAGSTADLSGYRIAVQGTYPQVVAFLGACESQTGATRVVSFRINAASLNDEAAREAGLLDATIETTHIKLTLPAAPKRSQPANGALP